MRSNDDDFIVNERARAPGRRAPEGFPLVKGRNVWGPLTVFTAPPHTTKAEELYNDKGQILGFVFQHENGVDNGASYAPSLTVGGGDPMIWPFPDYEQAKRSIEYIASTGLTLFKSSEPMIDRTFMP